MPVLKKLQEVFEEAMKSPDHIEKMDKAGLTIRPMRGEEYANFVRNLHTTIKPL